MVFFESGGKGVRHEGLRMVNQREDGSRTEFVDVCEGMDLRLRWW